MTRVTGRLHQQKAFHDPGGVDYQTSFSQGMTPPIARLVRTLKGHLSHLDLMGNDRSRGISDHEHPNMIAAGFEMTPKCKALGLQCYYKVR